jgi:6-phospho-beta-glucosidase
MIQKLTVLGGSSVYIPEFILSLISHNILPKEVVLFGQPGKKLEIVSAFCQRLVAQSGYPSTVRASSDLEDAVQDAEYVLNHIRVGGMKARIRDEKLPPTMGMIGDESLGAGGMANALRTLPIILDLAKQIELVNPTCTFINLTNPMGIVLETLIQETNLNVIGVCDLPGTYTKEIAKILHIPEEELYFSFIGLNHMGWIQDVRAHNSSKMLKVLDHIASNKSDWFDVELIELFRMIPTRTVSLYFHADRILKEQQSQSQFRGEVLHEAEKQILKMYSDLSLHEIPPLTRERNTSWYEETIIPLITALESKKPKSLILGIRNDGAIRDLPDDCSVEIPVTVSKKGLEPRNIGSCPYFLKGLFQIVKESDRCIVEAAKHRSYEKALQALTINPLVPSLETAKKFLDRIIKDEKFELH